MIWNLQNKRSADARGFSLVELTVVIAVLGLLAAVAMSGFTGTTDAAKQVHADQTVAKLNAALKQFSQANWTMMTAKDDNATTDEVKVLKSLQWSNPTLGGTEAFTPYWQPAVSSATTDYRVRWNGFIFELLAPGATGSGFKLDQKDGDMKSTPVNLAGFSPDLPAAG